MSTFLFGPGNDIAESRNQVVSAAQDYALMQNPVW